MQAATTTTTTTAAADIEELLDNDDLDGGDLLDLGYDGDSDSALAPNLDDESSRQRELEESRLNISAILEGSNNNSNNSNNSNNYLNSMSALLNQTTVMDGGILPSHLEDLSHTTQLSSQLNRNEQSMLTTDSGEYISYEDLCRQHMEKFMTGVEKFTRETKLVRRVNEWETRIVPMLEDQDRHEQFDIRKERSVLLSELRAIEQVKVEEAEERQRKQKEESKAGEGAEDSEDEYKEGEEEENEEDRMGEKVRQPEVALRELAMSRQPFEVSRMFVSLLQMVGIHFGD